MPSAMAQRKAHEVDGWLARPDRNTAVVLLYGPDRGLVSERARSFVTAAGFPVDDPFSVVRLDAADCDRQPGLLLEEASTVPMFTDRRLVWVGGAGAQKRLADDVKALCEAPPAAATVLIEAGELKKGTGLRGIVEDAAAAMALPCYADGDRDLDSLIDQEMQRAGLRIDSDARQLLRRSLGGDRQATRRELEKLTIFASGEQAVTADHVVAIIGDASGMSTDEVVDAVLAGRPDQFDRLYARQILAGNATFPILSAAQRQFTALHLMRGVMRRTGGTAGAAVASARPPVFFSRRALVEQVLARMPEAFFDAALRRIGDATLSTRINAALATTLTRSALLSLAIEIARSRR